MLVSELAQDVMIEVRDIPTAMAEKMVIDSAREFCRKSGFWRETITPITVSAGTDTYTLTPTAANTKVREIVAAVLDDTRLERTTERKRLTTLGDTGTPTQFVSSTYGSITLVKNPTADATLTVRVELIPTTSITDLDDRMCDDYGEIIVHGAVYRLAKHVGRNWSSSMSASDHFALFERGISDARARANDDYTTGVRRTIKYGGY